MFDVQLVGVVFVGLGESGNGQQGCGSKEGCVYGDFLVVYDWFFFVGLVILGGKLGYCVVICFDLKVQVVEGVGEELGDRRSVWIGEVLIVQGRQVGGGEGVMGWVGQWCQW